MIDWFLASFQNDPAGWIAVFIAAAAIILSAVFWRRAWAVLKAIGRGVLAVIRAFSNLRITTADRLPPKDEILVPARWVIRPNPDQVREGGYWLANVSEGTIARKVLLHSLDHDAQLLTSAAWAEIPGGKMAPFKMRTRDGAFFFGVSFRVDWSDERGRRRSEIITERWG